MKQPFSRACPYDCQAGMHSSEQTWTEHKRGWCCRTSVIWSFQWLVRNRGLGCPVGSQPPAPSARGSSHSYDCDVADPISEVVYNGPVQHSEQKRYDCALGFKHKRQKLRESVDFQSEIQGHHGSREMWSQEKAQYCRQGGISLDSVYYARGFRSLQSSESAARLWLAVKGVQYEYTGDCHGDRSGRAFGRSRCM